MSELQLSNRSSKARDLVHALARRTGQPINRLVEQALERYDRELRENPQPPGAMRCGNLWPRVDARCLLAPPLPTTISMTKTACRYDCHR